MEDEYEVGEYYRTKNGHIFRIVDLDEYGFLLDKFYYQIVKHSKNIIDLVEIGDYVNGYKVMHIAGHYVSVESSYNYDLCFEEQDIKSVVTKEQMASVEYKLEEDK